MEEKSYLKSSVNQNSKSSSFFTISSNPKCVISHKSFHSAMAKLRFLISRFLLYISDLNKIPPLLIAFSSKKTSFYQRNDTDFSPKPNRESIKTISSRKILSETTHFITKQHQIQLKNPLLSRSRTLKLVFNKETDQNIRNHTFQHEDVQNKLKIGIRNRFLV